MQTMRTTNLEYIAIEELPGVRFFHCTRLHATIRPEHCAARWRESQDGRRMGETFSDNHRASACRSCRVGQGHASSDGTDVANVRPVQHHCTRCGRADLRLIPSQKLCISCSNRAAEARRGRNARGKYPVQWVPTTLLRLALDDGGHRWVEAQNDAEALARHMFEEHTPLVDAQPGASRWNAQREAFEYVNADGNALVNDPEHGRLRPASSGEAPAPVTKPHTMLSAGELRAWLELDDTGLSSEWRWQPYVCSECRRAPLQSRVRKRVIECRCPSCSAES